MVTLVLDDGAGLPATMIPIYANVGLNSIANTIISKNKHNNIYIILTHPHNVQY